MIPELSTIVTMTLVVGFLALFGLLALFVGTDSRTTDRTPWL